MQEKKFDVLIVGAGPAGSACALELSRSGLSVAILDKATFPRDKTCGDALSVDVINQLPLISTALASDFRSFVSKTSSYGVKMVAPSNQHIDIPFVYKGEERSGYICTRVDFDNLLVQQVKQLNKVSLYEDCPVQKVEVQKDYVRAFTDQGIFTGKIILGADGAQSVVARQLAAFKTEREHYSAGLRVYYEGVTSFHEKNFIELYFFTQILPGYLWVFPLPDNKANVGIGMLSSEISKKKINLKEILQHLLTSHPGLNERFKNAKPLETVKGHGLPLGSKKRKISGERFLLLGDAASLIDPFTGEGIGNAIRSGRVAALHVMKCFERVDFSSTYNSLYDKEIYKRMWKELRISRTLQQLCRHPWLFNFVIKKANQSKYVHQLLIAALAQVDSKKLLTRPGFFYRLLFK